MANSADYTAVNGDLTLMVRELAANTVSTLFNSIPIFAALAIMTAQKPDAVLGVGDPSSDSVIAGCDVTPAMVREWEQMGQYCPLIESIRESDTQWMAYRDNMPSISTHSGSDPSFTITTVNGTVTAVAVGSGGTGFSGSPPTLLLIDASGSAGFGCELLAVVSGGVITGVTVQTGGFGYAATASIIVNSGYSEAQKYSRPVFKWAQALSTGQFYDSEVDASIKMIDQSDDEAVSGAVMGVVSDALKRKLSENVTAIAQKFWTGLPSDESQTFWNSPFGILYAVDDGSLNASYAGVDRTLAANYWWRSPVDNNQNAFGLKELVEDAHFKKGLAYKNAPTDLFIVDPIKYAQFRTQAVDYTQEVNLGEGGALREMGMSGFKVPALKYGNTYCISDFRCPRNTAIGLFTKGIVVAFKKGKKFAPSPLYPQHGIPNGIKGSKFFVETQIMPMYITPSLNCKYTNLV